MRNGAFPSIDRISDCYRCVTAIDHLERNSARTCTIVLLHRTHRGRGDIPHHHGQGRDVNKRDPVHEEMMIKMRQRGHTRKGRSIVRSRNGSEVVGEKVDEGERGEEQTSRTRERCIRVVR